MARYRCRTTPLPVAREIRQEARFGCALCGCPVLENAHIIPYRTSKEFVAKDMVALCPTCHTKADLGEYSETYMREIKNEPYNRRKVEEAFVVESDSITLHLGSCTFTNTNCAILVDDFELISLRRRNGQFLDLDVNFFDEKNNWVGIINESQWVVDTHDIWDLQYQPRHPIIRNAPRSITMDLKIEKGEVYLKGQFYFNGASISIDDTQLSIVNEDNTSLHLQDVTMLDAVKGAIDWHTPRNRNIVPMQVYYDKLGLSRLPN